MQYPLTASGVNLYNGKFTNGDPLNSIPRSIDRAEDMNRVYDEIIAAVIDAGLTPSEADSTQLKQAIIKAMGRCSGFKSVNATSTLSVDDLGKHVQIAQATAAGQIITLPALSNFVAGSGGRGYWFTNDSPNSVTIKGNASENINPLGTNSFLLLPKETVFVLQQANVQWNVFGAISAMNNLGLGYNQTWQDVTASRALATVRTNTTGKPITVYVRIITSSATSTVVTLTVSGVAMQSNSILASGAGAQISAIVPPGATYRADIQGGTGTLNSWIELT